MTQQYDKLPPEAFKLVKVNSTHAEQIARPSLNFWQDAWLRLRKNKAAVISMIVLIFIVIIALVGPHLNSYGYNDQNVSKANLPPKISWLAPLGIADGYAEVAGKKVDVYAQKNVKENYWFGTDSLGRDLFTRVWKGSQISLLIAFVAALVDVIIGVAYGGISGYYGGKVDDIMQRIIEILAGIPNLIIVILMLMVMEPGITAIIIAIALTGWIGMSRIVRGQVLKFKNQEFVLASRTLGASNSRIIFKHLLPNIMAIIVINTMFTVPTAIFFEAFLSFIGLGLQAPNASLGTLINDGYKMLQFQPYMLGIPAAVLSILMIAFNLLGDGLRDALDPKMKD
ncbi:MULTISPECIES: oligopeptide ABC transporter permease [unclassified Rummeliibacillus]|uniref:oligopeptide ABC transporter permease n=1 Tax=unclassified Rummeliibacillus TaxID=2622809 RepID=UPI000E669BA6|nr:MULTISPECIES: oligopeptide ABC transporter permease [unclassified Rummeliibacillus]RIJ63445.1 ABC transporter permease [Rummeliibacillus sp. POC4]RPJ96877.1 ABC transporter permease [Rummeliibacillus sp. TYF005]